MTGVHVRAFYLQPETQAEDPGLRLDIYPLPVELLEPLHRFLLLQIMEFLEHAKVTDGTLSSLPINQDKTKH